MAKLIKGITVILYEQQEVGKDAFLNPVFGEVAVPVHNVLVSPVQSEGAVSDVQLHGKHRVYELSIPKEDNHVWEDRIVEFFGQKWRTVGFAAQYLSHMVPLDWNKKIKAEQYG